jgi:hypothetical protein
MKMQQMRTVSRCPFGKYRDVFLLVENFSNFLIDDPRMPAAAPAQENGVVSGCEPANQRPVPNLFLGDKGSRQRTVDHIDIDPGNVICNQQRARYGMGQIRLNLHPESLKQRTGPTGFEAQAEPVAANRENAEHEKSPAENQQGQAKYPEGADENVIGMQSSYSR